MTVRLIDITAIAHSDGNRIDLSWTNLAPAQAPGVRVVRRTGTHPAGPDDGVVVAHGTGVTSVSDTGLAGETVYYYTLFPFHGSPPVVRHDPHNQVSAMATGRTTSPAGCTPCCRPSTGATTPGVPPRRAPACRPTGTRASCGASSTCPAASSTGSTASPAPRSRSPTWTGSRAALLPLLAAVDRLADQLRAAGRRAAQRDPLRARGPTRPIGGVPNLDATVTRITGWANRTKEFVHNVARTNQPERLNLWSALRGPAGTFAEPALASVNFAYDGRPTAVREADGSVLFFFHTHRLHGWDIWAKRYAAGAWQPSQPVVDRPGTDKHPSAALAGDRLWLFWQAYDPTQAASDRFWRIWFTTRTGGTFAAPAVFGDPGTERRMPAAVADDAGGLWLFWLERSGGTWQVRYNRHDGTNWQLATADGPCHRTAGSRRRVDDDLLALFHPTSASQRLWLFWARHEPGGPPGQTRWSVVYRIKQGLDPAAADWSPIRADAEDRYRRVPRPAAGGPARGGREPRGVRQLDGERRLDDRRQYPRGRAAHLGYRAAGGGWAVRAPGAAGRRHRYGHAAGVPV